jgi:hypothetical protein
MERPAPGSAALAGTSRGHSLVKCCIVTRMSRATQDALDTARIVAVERALGDGVLRAGRLRACRGGRDESQEALR